MLGVGSLLSCTSQPKFPENLTGEFHVARGRNHAKLRKTVPLDVPTIHPEFFSLSVASHDCQQSWKYLLEIQGRCTSWVNAPWVQLLLFCQGAKSRAPVQAVWRARWALPFRPLLEGWDAAPLHWRPESQLPKNLRRFPLRSIYFYHLFIQSIFIDLYFTMSIFFINFFGHGVPFNICPSDDDVLRAIGLQKSGSQIQVHGLSASLHAPPHARHTLSTIRGMTFSHLSFNFLGGQLGKAKLQTLILWNSFLFWSQEPYETPLKLVRWHLLFSRTFIVS